MPKTAPVPATADTHGFGATNVIAPVTKSRSSSVGGGGGGGDAGAGASAGRVGGSDCTSTDAANALRTWIIDTQPTGEVKTKCLGPFFAAAPWAKEMLMEYEAPSDFCKEHSSLVSYYEVNGVALISALPTVDGVPLVLSVVESTGFDFRCNVGSVATIEAFAERFCSGIPKQFGLDSLGRSLVIIPNPDSFEPTYTIWAERLFTNLDPFVGHGAMAVSFIQLLASKPFCMDPMWLAERLLAATGLVVNDKSGIVPNINGNRGYRSESSNWRK